MCRNVLFTFFSLDGNLNFGWQTETDNVPSCSLDLLALYIYCDLMLTFQYSGTQGVVEVISIIFSEHIFSQYFNLRVLISTVVFLLFF